MTAPLDPDSPRGRELAAELTIVLDDVEAAIARRRAEQHPKEER